MKKAIRFSVKDSLGISAARPVKERTVKRKDTSRKGTGGTKK